MQEKRNQFEKTEPAEYLNHGQARSCVGRAIEAAH
jgi:hypothetical protein